MVLRLTKHHGLGNDFLVLAGDHEPHADLARAACHRTRGIGADGLLYLGAGDGSADVAMVLLNADGSRAEMSGNGIGCLVQAAVRHGQASGPLVRVATDAGLRIVDIVTSEGGRHDAVTVGMGPVAIADDTAWAVDGIERAVRVEVGNPHLVLLPGDPALVRDREWLAELGAKANATIAGGVNVEVIAGAAGGTVGAIDMDVYERGVGLTDACGTGAVAAAVGARRWGLVTDDVAVTMHGGTVGVDLTGDEPRLTTTITYVGAIEYPW